MGLEKAIQHGKERRRPYLDSRSFDYSCRNHGDCPWCIGNRTVKDRKVRERLNQEMDEGMKADDRFKPASKITEPTECKDPLHNGPLEYHCPQGDIIFYTCPTCGKEGCIA